MKKYRNFLYFLLAANIMFILITAGYGFQMERNLYSIEKTTGTLAVNDAAKQTNQVRRVIPCGRTVGIYVNTNGILVIDTGEVTDLHGNYKTPAKNKLLPGDYIIKLNGTTMKTKKQLISAITGCDGETLVFTVNRNNREIDVKVEPVQTETDYYKVGIWVRDDLQGLGTITYLDGNQFGALGHSINDMDTGMLMDVSGGEIYDADILGLEKGKKGMPGEIEGYIAYQTERIVGDIAENRLYGIFGTVTKAFQTREEKEQAIEIADADEVETGKAYIQSYVSGEKKLYEIEIVNIHKNGNGDKEMEIYVTDDNLVSLTGGIIQGMSGSPILQNGKIVGAVTHVFVDNPRKGYGIFVETMRKD